jgi:hypothetical protein
MARRFAVSPGFSLKLVEAAERRSGLRRVPHLRRRQHRPRADEEVLTQAGHGFDRGQRRRGA